MNYSKPFKLHPVAVLDGGFTTVTTVLPFSFPIYFRLIFEKS
jgi:hypothetical protein